MNNLPNYVISYRNLRRRIGEFGMAIPLLLPVIYGVSNGHLFDVLPSISHYYYSSARSVFTGMLWSIAVFLYSYRGPEKTDDSAGTIAGISAICVTLLPTAPVDS